MDTFRPAFDPAPDAAAPHDPVLHPDRVLPLQGASNFRDLGGYPGRDGRPLRWRRLFRSDHLGALTEADHQTLAGLGLARALDFRGGAERAALPNRLPGVAEHPLPIEPTVVQRMHEVRGAGRRLDAALAAALMTELYRHLVTEQAPRYAALFQHLLHDEDTPLVFHCTAGKDRTGVAAALILLALGVPRELVLQDFLLTNRLYQPPPQALRPGHTETPPEALAVLWGVQEAYLAAALQLIDDEHGGVDRYLALRLGLGPVQREALAARYLQPG